MEQIPFLAHQEENTFYSFRTRRDILLQEDSAWTLPEPVQHTLQPRARILTASGFSFNEAPAVGL